MKDVEFFGRSHRVIERLAAAVCAGVGTTALATTLLPEKTIHTINEFTPNLDANNGFMTFALGLAATYIGMKKLQTSFTHESSESSIPDEPDRKSYHVQAITGIRLITAWQIGDKDDRVYDVTTMGGNKRYTEKYTDRDYMTFIPGEVLSRPN